MPKPLSYEALFAALTVVGAAACSKAAPSSAVKAEPAPVTVSSDAPASGAAAAPPPAAPVVATEKADTLTAAPSAKPVGATEQKKPMPRSMNKPTPKGNAACGAGTCSDEMKK
jgi:hypothetical protein